MQTVGQLGATAASAVPTAAKAMHTLANLSTKCAEHANKWGQEHLEELKKLPGPEPQKKLAIVTCMDARLEPEAMFGLSLGDAHIIRVGGGRTPDALRSLIGSEWVLATNEIMVVHHTDCGFTKAKNDTEARHLLSIAMVNTPTDHLPMMIIENGDLQKSVKNDVRFLRQSPYIRKDAHITGWIWHTHEGKLEEVSV